MAKPRKPRAQAPKRNILLVTGLSGAGMTTVLKALEDLGYKAVDNLPLALVPALLSQKEGHGKPVAIGIDSRTWDFSAAKLLARLNVLKADKNISAALVFVDCEDRVLQQRYTETRRVHPLATDRPVADGVARERQMMLPLKRAADHVIDTSDSKAHELRQIVAGAFSLQDKGLTVIVTSFGFKHGVPREADLVFDVRFLDNPHWDAKLRPMTGRDAPVAARIRKDKGFSPFFRNLKALLTPLLPRYGREGKHYLTIALGCTGGRHRSVFVAEELAKWLRAEGETALLRHRDLDRHSMPLPKAPKSATIRNPVRTKTKRRKAA